MTRKISKLPFALCAALCAAAIPACQTFEMDKVEPQAVGAEQRLQPIEGKMDKSFIMLVIDKSGSMLFGVNSAAGCKTTANPLGYDRGGDCRWNALLDAFAGTTDGTKKGFLRKSLESNEGEGSALFGLATYPTGNACESGAVDIPLDAASDNVEAIIKKLNEIAPAGGTPTAPTLNAILSQDALLSTPSKVRKRFVMLLTDGSPNCNPTPANAARCDACNAAGTMEACNDLTSEPIACYPINTPSVAGTSTKCDPAYVSNPRMYGTDCLDKDHTVEAITALRDAGVDTFVIGFGNTGSDPATKMTLNAAAIAGGRPVGSDGDDIRFYEATDTDSLTAALEAILNAATGCTFPLNPPPRNCSDVELKLKTVATESVRTLVKDTEWSCTDDRADGGNVVVEVLDTPGDALCTDRLINSPAGTYELQFFYPVDL